FASGVGHPWGLAFDSQGNLFEADAESGAGNGSIFAFTPGGTKSTFATGLTTPTGLAFDAAGNLYVGEVTVGYILEFDPTGARSTFASVNTPEFLAFGPRTVPDAPSGVTLCVALTWLVMCLSQRLRRVAK